MSAWLAGQARWVGEATIPGRLVNLGSYPGLVAAQAPGERVRGEVWEMPENVELLQRLDRYEGCHAEDPAPHEYERIVCSVALESEERLECWTYRYLLVSEDLPIVNNGDWDRRECIYDGV